MELAEKQSGKFLFISSGEVYGEIENCNISINENYCGKINYLDSRAVYAESKRVGELICKSFSKKNNLKVMIARLFHTYDRNKFTRWKGFSDFVNAVVKKKDIILNSKGSSKRPFAIYQTQ